MNKEEYNRKVKDLRESIVVLGICLGVALIMSVFLLIHLIVEKNQVKEIRFFAGEVEVRSLDNNMSIRACDLKIIIGDLKNKEINVPPSNPCPK